MVPVGKKPDGLARVGDLEEAQWAVGALRDLAQADKDADNANSKNDDAQHPPLAQPEPDGA
jgi:hypothetical protein